MINYIKGDITKVTSGLIIHGTNCSGGFGGGISGVFGRKWPTVEETFRKTTPGKDLLGVCIPVKISSVLAIGNCYTQETFGPPGKVYANAKAIGSALENAIDYAIRQGFDTVSMPKIGAGLGGLDWKYDVEPVIEEVANRHKDSIAINVYYID